ncbi:MAG: DarT ssDNA thymidine ADP-ribosyltransferase family protein, partial [Oxalobacter sp.]
FNILVSIKDVLNYGPAQIAYAELARAKEYLSLAEDVMQEIRKLENHPTFNKISESTKNDTDIIHFLIADLKQAIDEVKPPPPKQKMSFAEAQQHLTEQFKDIRQNAKDIQSMLRKRNVKYLYHLTDRRNLNAIRYHQGIYARSLLSELDIVPEYPGATHISKNIDSDRHTENYVHLYLTENQHALEQMKKRGLDPVTLKIKTQVASLQSTEFADMDLGHPDTKMTTSAVSHLDFLDSCTASFDSGLTFWKTNANKSEAIVLVKNGIPKEYIQNLDNFS